MLIVKWTRLLWMILWSMGISTSLGAENAYSAVVFVLAATDKVVVTNPQGQRYSALPVQRLLSGHRVTVPKGQRFSVLVLNTGKRRVFYGPAQLEVVSDTIRLLSGAAAKVFSLAQQDLSLVDRWINLYERPKNAVADKVNPTPTSSSDVELEVVQPIDGSLLLTRTPEFVFKGELPREGSLLLFDSKGKRFWVEPIESQYLTFPSAAKFEWGQRFTWEVRRLTGGRVLHGSFNIASQDTARTLLQARIPDLPSTLPESMLFDGMRLQLAGAYREANQVWERLGMSLSPTGRPSQIRNVPAGATAATHESHGH